MEGSILILLFDTIQRCASSKSHSPLISYVLASRLAACMNAAKQQRHLLISIVSDGTLLCTDYAYAHQDDKRERQAHDWPSVRSSGRQRPDTESTVCTRCTVGKWSEDDVKQISAIARPKPLDLLTYAPTCKLGLLTTNEEGQSALSSD